MRPLKAGSQCDWLLKHFKRGRTITQWQAVHAIGCLRLSERVRELKARGHRIITTMVYLPNGSRYARYRMAR